MNLGKRSFHSSTKKEDDLEYVSNVKKRKVEEHEEGEGVSRSEETKKGAFSKENFAKNYLLKHGYKEGSGLGKYQNGIIQPVEASKQKGRRGIGFELTDLKDRISKYDPSLEEVLIDEEVIWLINDHPDAPDRKCLDSWIKTGDVKRCIDDSSEFCDPDIINSILSSKNVFDPISSSDIKKGSRRSNPFESISKGIFLNRAAMKMANLDSILDRMFTEPKNMNGEKIVGPNELLYFADVCAGPGGFSEYVLYKKKWRARGFGFTLREKNDFLLDQFWAGPSESFEPHYGALRDGNVYKPENIISFKEHVLKYTDGKGVHFMMADGGIEIDEKHSDQELISKKLYLCQCIVALHIVRTDGHFVVKLFDIFTDFSVGLVYLMYRSFREISIIKPNTSRPANSERYLICKWKREDSKDIADHLFEINKRVLEHKESQKVGKGEILEIVPVSLLTEESNFYNYIKSSNDRLGKRQIVNLLKLATYVENSDLQDERQQELRKVCLKKWDIPDEARAEPKKCDAHSKWRELMGNTSPCDLDCDLKKSKIQSFEEFKRRICAKHSWYYLVLSEEEPNSSLAFYMGLGRYNVYKYALGKWTKLASEYQSICLPANTLVYGELVREYLGSGRSQRKIYAFHIIDGLFLGGEDIRRLPFSERLDACRLFAKSLYRESCPVRVKNHHSLADINKLWENLTFKSTKSSSLLSPCISLEGDSFYKAFGVMFIRDTRGTWNRYMSRKGFKYLDFSDGEKQMYEMEVKGETTREIYGDFEYCFGTKLIWWWEEGDIRESHHDSNRLTKTNITRFVEERK